MFSLVAFEEIQINEINKVQLACPATILGSCH